MHSSRDRLESSDKRLITLMNSSHLTPDIYSGASASEIVLQALKIVSEKLVNRIYIEPMQVLI